MLWGWNKRWHKLEMSHIFHWDFKYQWLIWTTEDGQWKRNNVKKGKTEYNQKGMEINLVCNLKFLCYIWNICFFPPTDSSKQVFIYLSEVHTIILCVPIYKNFIEHSNYRLLSLLALGTSSRPTCHYTDNNKIIPPSNNLHILFNGMCKIW